MTGSLGYKARKVTDIPLYRRFQATDVEPQDDATLRNATLRNAALRDYGLLPLLPGGPLSMQWVPGP